VSLVDQIRGLERNLEKLRARQEEMTGPEYCPPAACCPSCFWGDKLTEIDEAIERREYFLKVYKCKLQGLKSRKARRVTRLSNRPCGACGGAGHTTKFSVGACRCGEPRCLGRGVCHTCRGSGRAMETVEIVIRPWPKEFS